MATTTDPAKTKTKLEVPIQAIITVHRMPLRVPTFNQETGETIIKKGFEDKDPDDQELELEAADTVGLVDDMLRRYPRSWAQFQGDGGQFALLEQAISEKGAKSFTLRQSTMNWLHGKGESGSGKSDGTIGILHRKEPAAVVKNRLGLEKGEELPDDWKQHQQTVAMILWGLNEEKFCRYLMTAEKATDIPDDDLDE